VGGWKSLVGHSVYTIHYSTKNREHFRTLKITQYSEHCNLVKNYCRQKIKKAFKSLKSLLLKSTIDISIWLILYGDIRTQIDPRPKIFYKLYEDLWREVKFTQKCGLRQSKEWIFTFNFLFYWVLYDFFSPRYWTLKQKRSLLFQHSIIRWRKIVPHSIRKQIKDKDLFFRL